MNSVLVGVNPIVWSNDDLRTLGGDIPLEVCLKEAAEAGYDGIELGHKLPRDAAVLGPILSAHGLRLVSGWYSSRLLERSVEEEIAALQDHLTLLRELGCSIFICAEVSDCVHGDVEAPLSTRPVLDDPSWDRLSRGLDAVARYLREQGVPMAYHHHMGTVIQTQSEVEGLMDRTHDVGLLLDTGHLHFAGGDPLAVARRFRERINHVHFKDIRSEVLARMLEQDAPFLKAVPEGVFTVPGDGCIDYPSIAKVLAGAEYRGWLVVEAEQDPVKAPPARYARLGYQNTVNLARDAGLMEA